MKGVAGNVRRLAWRNSLYFCECRIVLSCYHQHLCRCLVFWVGPSFNECACFVQEPIKKPSYDGKNKYVPRAVVVVVAGKYKVMKLRFFLSCRGEQKNQMRLTVFGCCFILLSYKRVFHNLSTTQKYCLSVTLRCTPFIGTDT